MTQFTPILYVVNEDGDKDFDFFSILKPFQLLSTSIDNKKICYLLQLITTKSALSKINFFNKGIPSI